MKLTYKKGKQDKIHISVDGEYSFTVDETYFLSMGIYNGKEIDSDELEEIRETVNVRRAYNYAVSLIHLNFELYQVSKLEKINDIYLITYTEDKTQYVFL